MKKVSMFAAGCVAALTLMFAATVWAGQLVTSEDRSWAEKAVEQEKNIDISECPPNTVAVFYFVDKSGRVAFKPLEKGIAIMLITDLSKLDRIQIVERTRFQALLEELELADAGLVDRQTAPEVGRILCAQTVVGGEIVSSQIAELKFDSELLDVSEENISARPTRKARFWSCSSWKRNWCSKSSIRLASN